MIKNKADRMHHARLMYEANKRYVEKNINRLTTQQCIAFAKQQDRLYLRMWGEK